MSAELTVRELVDEILDDLEDNRLEEHLTPAERSRLTGELEQVVRRIDGEKLDPKGDDR